MCEGDTAGAESPRNDVQIGLNANSLSSAQPRHCSEPDQETKRFQIATTSKPRGELNVGPEAGRNFHSKVGNMLSRRSFLTGFSAASTCAFGQSVTPASAREMLASVFHIPDRPPVNREQWRTFGRIVLRKLDDSVWIEDGFAVHDGVQGNCEFSFSARAPEGVEEVQIWAGVRCRDRDSRYVFALRGGNNDDLYLARYAPDGGARFLGFAPLHFHPVPGTWYTLRAVVTDDRIQIYLDGEALPRLNVRDDAALWTEGGVSIGGGWLPVQFRNVSVRPLAAHDYAKGLMEGRESQLSPADKSRRRTIQRNAYRPMVLEAFKEPRAEFALDGEWLFAPDHELTASAAPQAEDCDDAGWHVMDVPNFWTPCLTWLHAETGFPELPGISSTKGISDRLWEAELKRLDGYTFDWRRTSSAWYRQYIHIPAGASGRRFELRFEAIAKVAQVWVNGMHAGSHVGMFGEVRCDITDKIHTGRNTVAVHVIGRLTGENSSGVVDVAVTVEVTEAMLKSLPHGMYPVQAGGIWQPAKLVVTQETWIEDIYTKPRLDGLDFEVLLQSRSSPAPNIRVAYTIRPRGDSAILHESPATEAQPMHSPEAALHFSAPRLAPELWSPSEPNLYELELTLLSEAAVLDRRLVSFGFRTFAVKDGKLHLNGKPFWLRGADHFPHALRPNDAVLAQRFLQLARAGNVVATRTHTAPFSETWLQAADEVGMAASFEGTWPWLMLSGEPPSGDLLKDWSDEFLSLIRKHRNHPSIVLWTVNNEMKFEMFDSARPQLLDRKWKILSDMVKAIRVADPTRPIVCDSSYCRERIGAEYQDVVVRHGYDDGDIDDMHRYPGWYEPSFFDYFRGELARGQFYPGRPLISQEMSTGYPRNDDGHPCRFYLFKHYTPQSLVGYEAYENRDPAIFLKRQAFITKELAEAIRRTSRDHCSGILHFAYLSWFKEVYKAESIRPFETYHALQRALQPVLSSAELFGRHFYAGQQKEIRVCIVNDAVDSLRLRESELEWHIEHQGEVLARGTIKVGPVAYYANEWYDVAIAIPELAPAQRIDARLGLSLRTDGVLRSENVYDVAIAAPSWAWTPRSFEAVVLDGDGGIPLALRKPGVRSALSPQDVKPTEIAIITNGEPSLRIPEMAHTIRAHNTRGGSVLLFNSGPQLAKLFPHQVQGFRLASSEIATMRVSESPVFEGLNPLDLAWWELGSGELPRVCRGTHQLTRGKNGAEALAEVVNTHGYLQQPSDFSEVSGTPLFEMQVGPGRMMACELMLLEAAPFDPIASRLLNNLLVELGAHTTLPGKSSD